MLLKAIALTVALAVGIPTIPPLTEKHVKENAWVVMPSGMVVFKHEDAWVLYSTRMILCSVRFSEYKNALVVLTEYEGAMPSCYLIDVQPIGYYLDDPTASKNYNLTLYPLTNRTWIYE